MAYSDFKTPEEVIIQFDLHIETADLFQEVEPILPSDRLLADMENLSLASNISTEKARNELIISPILLEVRRLFNDKIGYFSGRTFNVAPNEGLNGECDFLLSANPNQVVIQAPVLTIVEAKNADITIGLGQCIAQMVAAFRFNERHGSTFKVLGGVTTGTNWKFLHLAGLELAIDLPERSIPSQLPQVLGILAQPFKQVLNSED